MLFVTLMLTSILAAGAATGLEVLVKILDKIIVVSADAIVALA